jgi:hypothetical protein
MFLFFRAKAENVSPLTGTVESVSIKTVAMGWKKVVCPDFPFLLWA